MIKLLVYKSKACPQCRVISPVLEELARGGLDITTVMVDEKEGMAEAKARGVRTLPTIFFMKDGESLDFMTGYKPKEMILQKIEELSK